MNKLPKCVTVGGKRLKFVVDGRMDSWGEYHHDKCEIRISSKCFSNERILSETVRHELVHASLSISGVGYCEKMEEEAIVRCLDEIFFPAWEKLEKQLNKTP